MHCLAYSVGRSVVLPECMTAVCNAILETEIFCRQYLNINSSCKKIIFSYEILQFWRSYIHNQAHAIWLGCVRI